MYSLQTGKSFLLQHKKHQKTTARFTDVAGAMRWRVSETIYFFAFLRLEDPAGPRRQGDVKRLNP